MIPVALTIAGSDPSGGAGIQADLKTFCALKVYGTAVITALTSQNTQGVSAIADVAPQIVAGQIDSCVQDIAPNAVKTGMLFTVGIVETVVAKIRQYNMPNVVIDPVMTSTSGSILLKTDARQTLCRDLLPLALIVTPNIEEARILTGLDIRNPDDMEEAALQIQGFGAKYVYIKGGHLEGDAIDVLFDGREFTRLAHERIATKDSHGTGCVLSAAIAAHLAAGCSVADAVRLAKQFVTNAIRNGLRLGRGRGPCDPVGVIR